MIGLVETGRILLVGAALCAASGPLLSKESFHDPRMWPDPVTRHIHIKYDVPKTAPNTLEVSCSWSPSGKNDWRPARVTPFISQTGLFLASSADIDRWAIGHITERRAAGLTRTVVFDPYPEAQTNGIVDVDFRITALSPEGEQVLSEKIPLSADNSDVLYVTDWSKVLQKGTVSKGGTGGTWLWNDKGLSAGAGATLATLTYPLDLTGYYAVFTATDPQKGPTSLRLSGDERWENISSSASEREIFWRWTKMDRQHLLIKPRFTFQGTSSTTLRYVKLVPLTQSMAKSLNGEISGKNDRFLAAYFEPYSWAFNADVKDTGQHREPLSAYADAGADMIDIQVMRIGMKAVFETRKSDQLLQAAKGDPIDGKVPVTNNVGQMQQYTNTLGTELKYARELGMFASANFGAGNSYPGSPLNSEFSEKHPDWIRESSLKYEIPEVRKYVLDLIREALEIGARGVSIDFCRYPQCLDSAETGTRFMRELRKLTNEYSSSRGMRVSILVRFPAKGAPESESFDYAKWAHEGLVDYLCPSNITGVYQLFDVVPYVEAAKGTKCKVLPTIDGISWGPVFPDGFLRRVKSVYDAGADGVYIYQADDPVLGRPWHKRLLTIAKSSDAVDRWWKNDAKQRPSRSKGIYITKPFDGKAYSFYERMRIYLEGMSTGKVETYIDGKLVGKFASPPYILGTDGDDSNRVVPNGMHTLTVRAQDGNGWLEQRFIIEGRE